RLHVTRGDRQTPPTILSVLHSVLIIIQISQRIGHHLPRAGLRLVGRRQPQFLLPPAQIRDHFRHAPLPHQGDPPHIRRPARHERSAPCPIEPPCPGRRSQGLPKGLGVLPCPHHRLDPHRRRGVLRALPRAVPLRIRRIGHGILTRRATLAELARQLEDSERID